MTLKYSDPCKRMSKCFSSAQFVRHEVTVYISSRSSVLIAKYSLQRKRSGVLFLFPDSIWTWDLKPSLNSHSFNWLKFTLRCISSLRPFVSCIAKIEFSLGLIKLRVIFSKFIYQSYVPNFFNKGAAFLNRVWIKRQNKSFGSSGKSVHLFFDMMALFSTLHHYSDLNMTEGMTSRVEFMEKSITKPF